MPAVVVSTPVRGYGFYNNPFDGYRFGYGFAPFSYRSPYNYQYNPYGNPAPYGQPSFYGTCAAVAGVGVVKDNCLAGTTAVSTGGDSCACYDRTTGWSGCGNTANGVCLGPTGSVIVNPVD